MPRIFANQEHGYGDPVIFDAGPGYSMGVAVQILSWLEKRSDCTIPDESWKSSGYGKLVEIGIPVRLGTIEFSVMSSYGDILISRIAGNTGKFYALCDEIRQLDINAT